MVLVHGAFADASSWNGIIVRLQGHTVVAPANPLCVLADDTYIAGGSMAQRAGAKIVEVEGPHLIMVSQPPAVTDVILEAAGAGAAR
jgi:hypothetical protein